MLGLKSRILAALRTGFPRTAGYAGADADVWCAGALDRAPSVAEFFCGEGTEPAGQGRLRRSRIVARATELAAKGTVSILFPEATGPGFSDPESRAIVAPLRIALRKALPPTSEALMADIRTSTTREDLRRIRKAGFTIRTTTDPEDVRIFHARHYVPLVTRRFPEDGTIMSLGTLLEKLERGGEIVCADLDGEWVAGLFNWAYPDYYAMGPLGIRDADDAVRQQRVVSALLVGSMERAVALGLPTAMLGYSVPFLGKGPIWFKAKWGCTLEVRPRSPTMQMFLDLRHAPVRKALADSPIIHFDGADLAVSTWLPPGEAALRSLIREAGRFPGIARWHVLADPKTLEAAASALDGDDRLVPARVSPGAGGPLWLGRLLRGEG